MSPKFVRLVVGMIIAFAIGVACRRSGLPVPAPHVLEGAALILALTTGYASVDGWIQKRRSDPDLPPG